MRASRAVFVSRYQRKKPVPHQHRAIVIDRPSMSSRLPIGDRGRLAIPFHRPCRIMPAMRPGIHMRATIHHWPRRAAKPMLRPASALKLECSSGLMTQRMKKSVMRPVACAFS